MNQMTPIAAGIASLGRGNDKMLVHMTPGEVQGLQSLAMAHGGSLTINPHTGLPEAGFLDKLLPTIIGAGLMMIPGMQGVAPWMVGAGVGGFEALRTGDIGKGLMAGLGAFGGAGLTGALSGMGAAANVGAQAFVPEAAQAAAGSAGDIAAQQAIDAAIPINPTTLSGPQAAMAGVQQLGQPGGMSQLGSALMGPEGYGGKLGATAAGIGALNAMGGFEQPGLPSLPEQARSTARLSGPIRRPYDKKRNLFTDYGILQPTYAAKGGEMHSVPELEDGGFVLTKKAVDGIGKGSNKLGQRRAMAGLGAIPIRGPGTGTSDSIPTTIEGRRPALVSNGEAYVPRKEVKRRGGAKKFYALMKKAEQAARRSRA